MNLYTTFARYEDSIERNLKAVFEGKDIPLYNMMNYQMGWRDEDGEKISAVTKLPRIYASMCLLIAEAFGGSNSDAMPSASALELVNNYSVIHQDLQDGIPSRNNRSTLWWLWGPAQSINAGDGMHALARLTLLNQRNNGFSSDRVLTLIDELDSACINMCEGEYLDLTYRERVDVSEEAYLNMVTMKSASLMSCALKLGAISANASQEMVDIVADFGEKVAIASQIKADIAALWDTRADESYLSDEVLNKKKSLPIIFALKNAKGSEKHILGDVYFKRVIDPEDINKMLDVLDILGAKEYSEQKSAEIRNQALDSLNRLKLPSEFSDHLEGITNMLSS